MRNFQCLLSVLKRIYIYYYIICMTVPLMQIGLKVRIDEGKEAQARINDRSKALARKVGINDRLGAYQ